MKDVGLVGFYPNTVVQIFWLELQREINDEKDQYEKMLWLLCMAEGGEQIC